MRLDLLVAERDQREHGFVGLFLFLFLFLFRRRHVRAPRHFPGRGRSSLIAWLIVSRRIDAFIAIPDERAREAIRALAMVAVVAGETGTAGLAGLLERLTARGERNIERRCRSTKTPVR